MHRALTSLVKKEISRSEGVLGQISPSGEADSSFERCKAILIRKLYTSVLLLCRLSKFDGPVKSRHSGENRSPENL